MQIDVTNKDLQTLLALYNHEVNQLREKLLTGEPWNELKQLRSNITELAKAIHKSHGFVVAGRMTSSNPAEFPKNETTTDQPVE